MTPQGDKVRTQERLGAIIEAARGAFAAHAQGDNETTLNELRAIHEEAAIAMTEITKEERWQREKALERGEMP